MSRFFRKAANKAERAIDNLNDSNGQRQPWASPPQPQPSAPYSYSPVSYGTPLHSYNPMFQAPPASQSGPLVPASAPPPVAYASPPPPQPNNLAPYSHGSVNPVHQPYSPSAGSPPNVGYAASPPPRPSPSSHSSFGSAYPPRAQYAPTPNPGLARESVPDVADGPRVRKILVLDGGGIRGLSEVILLQEIMQRLSLERGCPEGVVIHPWEEFDMIAGTSTGGILAIMLGRLRMSLDDVEQAYVNLSERIFQPVRRNANVAGKVYDFYKADGRFSAEPLEHAIRAILMSQGLPHDALMYEHDPDGKACKVFVCAMTGYASPQCLRSYRNLKASDRMLNKCEIWQAARATSAASTYFDPIEIGGIDWVDGGLAYNNPIQLAEKESREMFGDEERIFVSLGTGQGVPPSLTGDAKRLVSSLIKILTETEERNKMFHNEHQDWARDHKLFRFNVAHGVGEIGLEEYQRVKEIRSRTVAYLDDFETNRNLGNCSTALRSGGQRLHIIAGDELKAHHDRMNTSSVDAVWCVSCQQGIKYNDEAVFCLECDKVLHSRCVQSHDFTHGKSFIRFTCVQWQANSRLYAEYGTCQNCFAKNRCRISCTSCDWSLCGACDGVQSIRSEYCKKHIDQASSHRQYTYILPPFMHINRTRSGAQCPCLTQWNAVEHCGRCLSVIRIDETFFSCTTCRNEYGLSQSLCGNCLGDEKEQHLREHAHAAITLARDNKPNPEEVRHRGWCRDCNRPLQILELFTHPHTNLVCEMSPAGFEKTRHSAVRDCPTRLELDPDRPAASDPVDGVNCTMCLKKVQWGHVHGVCLSRQCLELFCSVCMATGRHMHRHWLHPMVYERNKSRGIDIGRTVSCDVCGKQNYRDLFVGIECGRCQNRHFCIDCIKKTTAGELALPGDGAHSGCPMPSNWVFHRY